MIPWWLGILAIFAAAVLAEASVAATFWACDRWYQKRKHDRLLAQYRAADRKAYDQETVRPFRSPGKPGKPSDWSCG